MAEFGRVLMIIGLIVIIIGFLLTVSNKLPFNFGRLPGDIMIKKEGFTFYFPITTTIIISVVLSLLFYLFGKFLK
ncbi:DUF2905 domain-containing protein [Sulfurovum sp. zt1-1]|uniref:DUF2905 domain-containing protein n=1 Tax=Sulfurovum zhangzhouensis TaxID=3019067 RepID=A0ABT7QXM1_9BACT|nr:DUF2905 domain-containing protein [Sulfurovum zhangzhouensis]MDM5271575.1 DUF2905 domain-containing protein [Sulfurovum zhangzhouensis]